jgi:hypothetical protein
VLALLVLGLGVLATARSTTNSFVPYVLRWWWAIPAIAALAVAWTAMTTCPERLRKPAATAIVGALVVTVIIDLAQLPAPVSESGHSRVLAALAEPTARGLDRERRYLVTSRDERGFLAATSALYVELDQRGFDVFAERSEGNASRYGSWRLAKPTEVDEVVTLVNLAEVGNAWHPVVGSRRVAFWDPLTFAQRARARELEARIRAAMGDSAPSGRIVLDAPASRRAAIAGGALPDEVEELDDLQQLGDGYAVYVSPAL